MFSFGCGDVTFNAVYGLAVVVCGGAQSMCKVKTWTCVFARPRRRRHSMCKDTTWTAGLLGSGLQSLSAAEQNPCVKIKSGREFSLGCGDVTFKVDYGLAVVVCGGAQSMCKDKKWTCVFVRPRRRLHSMRKDTTWTAGLLGIGLQSLSAANQTPCVKIKSGRVCSFGCGDATFNTDYA